MEALFILLAFLVVFIWILAAAMACGGIFSLVYLIIQSVNGV